MEALCFQNKDYKYSEFHRLYKTESKLEKLLRKIIKIGTNHSKSFPIILNPSRGERSVDQHDSLPFCLS
jgi:hypothetical protein